MAIYPLSLSTGSTAEIEEERRLLYVATTRAEDHLHLIVPQRFYAHQQRANSMVMCMHRAVGSFRHQFWISLEFVRGRKF